MKVGRTKFIVTALLSLAVACSTAQTVDPALVGTWEMVVPNAGGAALWVWQIRPDGRYDFHSEGPGDYPSHHGTFQAIKGKYVLKAANLDWRDSGTYDPPAHGIVRMTSLRLGTGYWMRQTTASAPISKDSTESELTKDPFKFMKNASEGIGEDGEMGHYDPAAAARIKAKNHDKIEFLPTLAAILAGSTSKKPVVIFYSGGTNIDALIYSDAMVALAGKAVFGLDTDRDGRDLSTTGTPQKSVLEEHVYPRILIVTPRLTADQLMTLVSQQPGQTVKLPPVGQFEWECLGVKSAQKWAAMVGTELQKLGH